MVLYTIPIEKLLFNVFNECIHDVDELLLFNKNITYIVVDFLRFTLELTIVSSVMILEESWIFAGAIPGAKGGGRCDSMFFCGESHA